MDEDYKFWCDFGKSKNIIKAIGFKNSYQIAKSTIDTDFIKQFSKLYAYKFTFKGIENGNVLLYRKDEKITNNILIKSICEQLSENLFMEYNKLNFNPTKYIVLNSWFDLKGPYTYEFLTEFKEKFYDYIDYNDIFEDYPEYKKYIDEKIYDDYKEKLSFRPTDESITIEKKQHQNYL